MPPEKSRFPRSRALVLLSGGQDSTTCLVWALERFEHVETLGIDYAQRHKVEMETRRDLLAALGAFRPAWARRLGGDHIVDLTGLAAIGETAMTEDIEIEVAESGLPNTFVPGRNLAFLVMAGALAYRRDIGTIVGGMCQTDYSGYPDCRADALGAMEQALRLGMEWPGSLVTPLMGMTKAEAWGLVRDIGGEPLVELVNEHTHSCYRGDRTRRFDWGYGCGQCPACELRAAGWHEAQRDQALEQNA